MFSRGAGSDAGRAGNIPDIDNNSYTLYLLYLLTAGNRGGINIYIWTSENQNGMSKSL